MIDFHQSRRHLSAVGVPPVATRARGRISPLLVVAAGLLLALAAGATVFVTKRPQSLTQLESRLHEADPFVEFVDRPAPAFVLSDGNDRIVRLADMRGRAVVLNFVYARCTDICPPHMALLADLQQRIRAAGLAEDVEFVTLATDTERAQATADIVREYGRRYGLDAANWHMLYRGERAPRAVIDLAAEYGLDFRVVTADGGHEHDGNHGAVDRQVHGAVFHVIDPDGRLRARLHGLRFQPQTLIRYLRAMDDAREAS